MLDKLLLALFTLLALSHAYSSSWEDCEAFAALWESSCAGVKSESAYDDAEEWHTSGSGATIINC